jgi:hypothetical protein
VVIPWQFHFHLFQKDIDCFGLWINPCTHFSSF